MANLLFFKKFPHFLKELFIFLKPSSLLKKLSPLWKSPHHLYNNVYQPQTGATPEIRGPLGQPWSENTSEGGPYFGNAPIPGQYPTQNLTDVVEVSKYPLGSGCGIWVIFYIPYLHSRFGLILYYFSSVKILIIENFFKFYLEGKWSIFWNILCAKR
jgi:hypothetical protein